MCTLELSPPTTALSSCLDDDAYLNICPLESLSDVRETVILNSEDELICKALHQLGHLDLHALAVPLSEDFVLILLPVGCLQTRAHVFILLVDC